MASMTTDRGVLVVAREHGGLSADAHRSLYEAVRALLDDGRIGDGCHGSDAHCIALRELIECARRVLENIAAPTAGRDGAE